MDESFNGKPQASAFHLRPVPMIGWFRSTCPVDPHAKDWIEHRLQWLAGEFGLEVFTERELILPLKDFFPDMFDASAESAQLLFNRVCGYMDVDPKRLKLEVFSDRPTDFYFDENGQPIAGEYEERPRETIIRIGISQLEDPMSLVGTLAHELAHYRLLFQRRISREVFDNELLTDLTVVFFGLGIFLANVPRAWPSDFSGHWPGTNITRPDYMTQPMFGYALAHVAWFRNQAKPAWGRHLCFDARPTFKQGLRYLMQTGDSKFNPQQRV